MHVLLFGLALILFIGLVVAHEWGHFIVAKRNKVVAEEFGIGFPPRAAGKKLSSGMVLSLNWLPLGGFVKLKGEHDADTAPHSYGAASLGAKTRILLAGVGMNLLVGLVLLTILAWFGMPVLIDKTMDPNGQFTVKSDTRVVSQQVEAGEILPGSPAAQIGLGGNDIIKSIGNSQETRDIQTPDQLKAATSHFAGQQVDITYKHSDQQTTKSIRLLSPQEVTASLKTDNPKGYLGVVPYPLIIQRSTWSAPVVAAGLTWQITQLSLRGIGHSLAGLGSAFAGLVTGNHVAREHGQTTASDQGAGGPLAIGKVLWNSGNLGINFVLILIALISISLALVNLFPIPALDGGRLYSTLIARGIYKRPLSMRAEEIINATGWIIIMALTILITIADVNRFY